jgi:hypothetical protein
MQRPVVNILPSPIITVGNEISFDVCLNGFRMTGTVFALNQYNIFGEILMVIERIISRCLSLILVVVMI